MNAVRRSKAPVSIFLTKGVRLQGVIGGFDNFSIELRRGTSPQLIYKHAISTIAPARAPDGFESAVGQVLGTELQDQFLGGVASGGEQVSLYLVNGVMLDGRVEGFDQYVVVLTRAGIPQMVYKHAISTLQPAASLALAAESAEAAEREPTF